MAILIWWDVRRKGLGTAHPAGGGCAPRHGRRVDDLDHIIEDLGHWDAGLRDRATTALRNRRPEATPRLLKALQHRSSLVRRHAALVLGQLAAAEAVLPLCSMAESTGDADERAFIARAISDLAHPAMQNATLVFSTCERFLRDPDLFVRALACAAFERLGDPQAIPLLDRCAGDPEPWVRTAAAKAAAELRIRHERVPQTPRTAWQALPKSSAQRATDPSAASSLPDPTAEPAIAEQTIRDAVFRLGHRDQAVREAALSWLAQASRRADAGTAVTDQLCRALLSPVLATPAAAIMALWRIGDRRALVPLMTVVGNATTDGDVRAVALRALAALTKPEDAGVLDFLVALPRPAEPLPRAAMTGALGVFPSARSQAALVSFLSDPEAFVRESTADALRRVAQPASESEIATVAEAFARETDARARAAIALALEALAGASHPASAVRAARGLQAREDAPLRGAAAIVLARAAGAGEESAQQSLAQLLGCGAWRCGPSPPCRRGTARVPWSR